MELIKLVRKYKELGIADTIDHEKFSSISIVHHSTVIEGSTLTEVETQVLINDDLTPKGKPFVHSQMVLDHYEALKFVIEEAKKKTPITIELIQKINSLTIKNTGSIHNTVFGEVDSTKGEFRKGNVFAGDTYFPNFDKVEKLTENLVDGINLRMKNELTIEEKINLSFDAHYNLVSIHPFYDGNGRTSRLFMNYLQSYYKLPLAIVHNENKVSYIEALTETRKSENLNIFRKFMNNEYSNLLKSEIKKYEEMQKPNKGKGFAILL